MEPKKNGQNTWFALNNNIKFKIKTEIILPISTVHCIMWPTFIWILFSYSFWLLTPFFTWFQTTMCSHFFPRTSSCSRIIHLTEFVSTDDTLSWHIDWIWMKKKTKTKSYLMSSSHIINSKLRKYVKKKWSQNIQSKCYTLFICVQCIRTYCYCKRGTKIIYYIAIVAAFLMLKHYENLQKMSS